MGRTYLALIRGINVGGNNLVKMSELKAYLEKSPLEKVRTYIQSGNLIFESEELNPTKLARHIESCIETNFKVQVAVVVIDKDSWRAIIEQAPQWWGKDPTWKHNLFVLLDPIHLQEVLEAMKELNPDIEIIQAGPGVIYQSMSLIMAGKASSSKLPGKPAFKQITIRNYNTATKLLTLL